MSYNHQKVSTYKLIKFLKHTIENRYVYFQHG